MIAVCVQNEPSRLADHQRGRAAPFEGTYPLTIGRRYPVVGMGITETVLEFLVKDDDDRPRFAPAGMFDVGGAAHLPDQWRFALGSGVRASGRDLWTNPVVATWGYRELVSDPNHVSALIDGDADALAVFERHVAEAERARR